MQKHILTINDISCIGRCSLTVALPVISAAGITAVPLPTAILSTHTTGFTNYTFRDLTEDMPRIASHWQEIMDFGFDAIYTGYLGSREQVEIVTDIIRRFKKPDTIVITDPVMADNGSLYAGFADDFPKEMARLCEHADVITPNITEALLMLGIPYQPAPYTRDFIEEILTKLQNKKTVLTGVHFSDSEYGAAVCAGGEIYYSLRECIPGVYNGTGDLFASVLSAALVSGCTLHGACDAAVTYTTESIKRTCKSGRDLKFGTSFEPGLHMLRKLIDSADAGNRQV